jgi:DNA-binding IclR family transcriptional regulator
MQPDEVRDAQPEERARPSHLGRGLQALEMLARAPRSAADVSNELGVNRSTSLRLLQDLESLGYARRDPRSKRFMIASERFMALAAPNYTPEWHEILNPVLERLRDEAGEATVLATPANGVMVYVTFYDSAHAVAVRERIGTVRPMHASALGKAWLSTLPDDALDAELGRIVYSGGSDRAARGPMELRRYVAEARERGWATDVDESAVGVSCVAAPARVGHATVGAVAILAPTHRMNEDVMAAHGQRLVDALGAIAA